MLMDLLRIVAEGNLVVRDHVAPAPLLSRRTPAILPAARRSSQRVAGHLRRSWRPAGLLLLSRPSSLRPMPRQVEGRQWGGGRVMGRGP